MSMPEEETRIAAFRAAVEEGEIELDRGEGVCWTPDLIDRLAQEALNDMKAGNLIDPDVLPRV